MDKISTLRTTIDALDKQIMTLLDQRMATAISIGEAKHKTQLNIEDKNREATIFKACESYTHKKALKEIYKTIIHTSKSLQREE